MSYLEIDGLRHPITVGDLTIGYDSAGDIALGRDVVQSQGAVVRGLPDGQVAIRTVDPKAVVLVNGVRLGPQPTPLLHGDKVEVAGRELLFVDDRRGGSTSFIQALGPDVAQPPPKPAGEAAATASTGGRLVSLTDGREYTVSGGSLLIGREAGCDVVIESKNVSRRHAEIVATPKGYLLIDSSTNGTIVNGERVPGQRLLGRGDVICCGDYEFRFYADKLEARGAAGAVPGSRVATPPPGAEQRLAHTMHGIPAVPRPAPGAGQPPQPPRAKQAGTPQAGAKRGPLAALRGLRDKVRPGAAGKPDEQPTPKPPPGADQRLAHTMHGLPTPGSPQPAPPRRARYQLQDTMHGIPPEGGSDAAEGPGTAAPAKPGPFAVIVVRSGAKKGERLAVNNSVVNIGRAEYNDIVLPDDSVSTVHAKLQRREGVWVLVDQDSTNGTVVDGKKITGETALAPGAIVRFGQVQTVFEPMDSSAGLDKGSATRVIQSIHLPPPADPRRRGSSSTDS
ncbi:MAG: FHA domain-containing protein [Gemmatimonadota bacterium]|nr:MAG: FHA domain-containing protein [Gemmatimonadota bacterium]